jgi:hypothetical protein
MTGFVNLWRFPWLVVALVICTALFFSGGMLLEYVCPYCEGTAFEIVEWILLLGSVGFSLWAGRRISKWFNNWMDRLDERRRLRKQAGR